jgi:hypothetical protein
MTKSTVYKITTEEIQANAESNLGRELTKSELKDVVSRIQENNLGIFQFIDESIEYVIKLNELMERNKNATKDSCHFRTYWKNPNAYREEFELTTSFKNLEDAREYVEHFNDLDQFDIWKIIEVKEGIESEVEIITMETYRRKYWVDHNLSDGKDDF